MTVRRVSHRATARIPFNAAPYGTCRWCGEDILKPDGTQNRRRNWHPECVEIYKGTWPQAWRAAIYVRDGGVCARCLPDDQVPLGAWEADHIVPLIDGGTWDIENGQTLCPTHHREKTAVENSNRAHGLRTQKSTSATSDPRSLPASESGSAGVPE